MGSKVEKQFGFTVGFPVLTSLSAQATQAKGLVVHPPGLLITLLSQIDYPDPCTAAARGNFWPWQISLLREFRSALIRKAVYRYFWHF